MNQNDRSGSGPEGYCVCVHCGHKEPHTPGVRCMEKRCPECGKVMFREGSHHHELAEAKKRARAEASGNSTAE